MTRRMSPVSPNASIAWSSARHKGIGASGVITERKARRNSFASRVKRERRDVSPCESFYFFAAGSTALRTSRVRSQ